MFPKLAHLLSEPIAEPKPRTYADDLLEKFPNAQRGGPENYPLMCLATLYGSEHAHKNCVSDADACAACWLRPIPDALTAQKGKDNA